jgi:hypothetical protein
MTILASGSLTPITCTQSLLPCRQHIQFLGPSTWTVGAIIPPTMTVTKVSLAKSSKCSLTLKKQAAALKSAVK